MGSKLKIGVFGAYRGKIMIDALLSHPDAELVAVCDKFEPALDIIRREAEEKKVKVALYRTFDEFIKHDMDAVVLANYANEHAVYAIRCLNAGKHVMSEVLPAESMSQYVELIETVERTGLVYTYAENYCYMQHTFEMWKRYQRGDIGEITYAEGEYIHDCSSIWHSITYGEREHWRNNMFATFYCTHSLGPILTITGRRPVKVVGFETPLMQCMLDLGSCRGGGIEMVTLDNGAVVKSIHGDLKREPSSVNYEVYGTKGMMETGRLEGDKKFNIYKEGEELCKGEWENYDPENDIASDIAKFFESHGGSDFYATHFFIEKILGRPDGKWAIDVYKAADMGTCGVLAYRSILNGNCTIDVPNLRNKEERDLYRNDTACTNPKIAGDKLWPRSSFGNVEIPDEVYKKVEEKYKKSLEKQAD